MPLSPETQSKKIVNRKEAKHQINCGKTPPHLRPFSCSSTQTDKGRRREKEGGGKKSRVTLQCYSTSQEVAVASQPATDADLLRGEIHNKTITL